MKVSVALAYLLEHANRHFQVRDALFKLDKLLSNAGEVIVNSSRSLVAFVFSEHFEDIFSFDKSLERIGVFFLCKSFNSSFVEFLQNVIDFFSIGLLIVLAIEQVLKEKTSKITA